MQIGKTRHQTIRVFEVRVCISYYTRIILYYDISSHRRWKVLIFRDPEDKRFTDHYWRGIKIAGV